MWTRCADNKARSIWAAIAISLGAPALAPSADAQTTTYRASVGCSLGNLPADITASELRCRCYQICEKEVVQPPTQQVTTAGGTKEVVRPDAVTCGALRFMASRASVGFPEGHSASQAVAANCIQKPDDYIPPPPDAAKLEGQYSFVRGYSSRNPGVNKSICESSYEGSATVRDGKITFNSGGHQWTGVITNNKWVLISRDGIDPRPKNPTVITGPIDNASLYNGYCGRGFFRISAR